MKSVMLSIRPQWCNEVANGKKTIEVRKTRPKLETPFKCYIYCTLGSKHLCLMQNEGGVNLIACCDWTTALPFGGAISNGKVIGEFVCDEITTDLRGENTDILCNSGCLAFDELREYGGNKPLYGWHISALQIYDKPKELSKFTPMCRYREDDGCCQHRKVACGFQEADYNQDGSLNLVECGRKVSRPPQSWCYVEELV